jgi:hypothetical protein
MQLMSVVNKAGLVVKKHSPEILAVVGVAGVVVSTVMACKATLKVDEVLNEHNENMAKIKSHEVNDQYTEEDQKKDKLIQYTHTVVNMTKLYAPAVGLSILSVGCLLGSNEIYRRRNAALMAAYAAIDKGFKEYRQRVVDRFGKEVDQQLRFGTQPGEVEKTVTDDKGKEKKTKEKVDVVTNAGSDYVRYFTRSNPYWENDKFYVEMFLNQRQAYFNDQLAVKKVLTLNDVYDQLGFHKTKAGMVVGWRYDEDNPSGDNYIQLDVKKVYLPNEHTGEPEEAYAIDFNVDGLIYDKVDDVIR